MVNLDNPQAILEIMINDKKTLAILGSFAILTIIMLFFACVFRFSNPLKPKGKILMTGELLMSYFQKMTIDVLGEKYERKFTPLTICIFTSMFLTNIAGLFALEEGAYANPIYPFTWSITMFLIWNIYAIIKIGPINFLKGIFTPILLTPLNLLGLITKPLSMGLRLLGNISSGTIIMLLFWYLPVLAFDYISTITVVHVGAFVGVLVTIIGAALSAYFSLFGPFIQATVFTNLTLSSFAEAITQKEELEQGE